MKIKNWINFNESKGVNHFLQLKEVIENIKDILIELDDNDVSYKIYPNDDLRIKVLSLRMMGFMGGVIDSNFYIEITLEKTNFEDFKESWLYYTLKHLENYIKSLDIYERELRTQYVLIKNFNKGIKEFNTIDKVDIGNNDKYTRTLNIFFN